MSSPRLPSMAQLSEEDLRDYELHLHSRPRGPMVFRVAGAKKLKGFEGAA